MKTYLDIVQDVLDNGEWKDNRTGTRALTCVNRVFNHDMTEGFPLLTTKKMPLKTIAVELEGMIQGITSKRWYQERSCKVWNQWANPVMVKESWHNHCQSTGVFAPMTDAERKILQLCIDDLGCTYPHSWRRFNQTYHEGDEGCITQFDQLQDIVDLLHNNPNDRRMICSSWNPVQMHLAALPACHFSWGVVHLNGVLHLHWEQRSCDLMLGVPFNIASYALLLLLLCKEANMKPGKLTGLLADCHIYENHIDGAKEQLQRTLKPLPKVSVTKKIFDWTHKDIELTNYNPHPKINMGKVAI